MLHLGTHHLGQFPGHEVLGVGAGGFVGGRVGAGVGAGTGLGAALGCAG